MSCWWRGSGGAVARPLSLTLVEGAEAGSLPAVASSLEAWLGGSEERGTMVQMQEEWTSWGQSAEGYLGGRAPASHRGLCGDSGCPRAAG